MGSFSFLLLREKDLNSALIELYSKAKEVDLPFDLAEANFFRLFPSEPRNFTSTNLNVFIYNIIVHKKGFLNRRFYSSTCRENSPTGSSNNSHKSSLLHPQ